MPRAERSFEEGRIYHVYNRVGGGSTEFADDELAAKVHLCRLEIDEARGQIRQHRLEAQTILQFGDRADDFGGHRVILPRLTRQAKTATAVNEQRGGSVDVNGTWLRIA